MKARHSYGAKGVKWDTTVTACQAKCSQLEFKCFVFEFNYEDNSCWVYTHTTGGDLYEDLDIVQYRKTYVWCACKL